MEKIIVHPTLKLLEDDYNEHLRHGWKKAECKVVDSIYSMLLKKA